MPGIEDIEVNELVLAKVSKIMPYGAFCELLEYPGLEGFLHISEVSSGWVKNIHEFLSEGKRLVVKVIRVDKEKGQVDISLKRVSNQEKRAKEEEVRKEKRAKALINVALKDKSEKFIEQVLKHYPDLGSFVDAVLEKKEEAFKGIKTTKKAKESIITLIEKNIKKKKIKIKRKIHVRGKEPESIEDIKEAMLNIEKQGFEVKYVGPGLFMIETETEDPKKAEQKLKKVLEELKNNQKIIYEED